MKSLSKYAQGLDDLGMADRDIVPALQWRFVIAESIADAEEIADVNTASYTPDDSAEEVAIGFAEGTLAETECCFAIRSVYATTTA